MKKSKRTHPDESREKNHDRDFLIDFWRFCRDDFIRDAPKEVKDAFDYAGLRAPKDDDDLMTVVFSLLAHRLPESLLSRGLIDVKSESKDVAERRGVLFAIMTHPAWNRIGMLEQLADRIASVRKEKPDDWKHWLYCIFGLLDLLQQRILADIQEALREDEITIDIKDTISTDGEMLERSTDVYRECLFSWGNEDDRPPFTKHDMWMALIQDKEMAEGMLTSPFFIVEERARRVMENYGLSKRDARIVVATMEQLGKVINLNEEEKKTEAPGS